MRNESKDKIHVEQNFQDDKGNKWSVKITEDSSRKFRLYATCNELPLGRPLYFKGGFKCFEYFTRLLKNNGLKEI